MRCHSITKITRNGINGAMFVTICPFLVIDDNTIKASIIFAKIDKFNRLISSLEHGTLNALMPILKPSVQPVLHLISRGAQTCANSQAVGSSDNHRMHRCLCIGSSGAIEISRTRPILRFFEFFLRVLLCMAFLLHPWDLEMFT